ncbi:MAG: 50S ribosomal protein L27 [bacterium]
MAHKLGQGSSKNGRDSQPKYLGVKLFDGQIANIGSILIRQRGNKFEPGLNVRQGKDDTLYAVKSGKVQFSTKKVTSFTGKKLVKKFVNVM